MNIIYIYILYIHSPPLSRGEIIQQKTTTINVGPPNVM